MKGTKRKLETNRWKQTEGEASKCNNMAGGPNNSNKKADFFFITASSLLTQWCPFGTFDKGLVFRMGVRLLSRQKTNLAILTQPDLCAHGERV